MFENEVKGWHGSFSTAGRNSAEKYHMIIHKDDIIYNKSKKKKVFGFFAQEENPESSKQSPNHEDLNDDYIDIFQPPFNSLQQKKEAALQKKKNSILCKAVSLTEESKNERFKYHQHNHQGNKEYIEKLKNRKHYQPSCTRYNPKMNFIWKRVLVGPYWKVMSSRDTKLDKIDNSFGSYGKYEDNNSGSNSMGKKGDNKNKNEGKNNFNNSSMKQNEFKPSSNIFINMNKQTQRGDFTINNDVRMRTDKPFISVVNNNNFNCYNNKSEGTTFYGNKKNIFNHYINNCNNTISASSNKNQKGISNKTEYSNLHSKLSVKNLSTANNSSENAYIPVSQNKPNKYNKTSIHFNTNITIPSVQTISNRSQNPLVSSYNSNSISYNSKKRNNNNSNNTINGLQNKAPDFSKTISRDYLNYLNRDRSQVSPFILPNYTLTEPRSIGMVSYNTTLKKNKIFKNIEGLNVNLNYDPNKILEKVNNHKRGIGPDFSRMTSRPLNESPLPSFMQKKFDRMAIYTTTDKTLKMNNFADGKYLTEYSSFYPKKSYNKMINLNLLNNDKFVDGHLDIAREVGKANNVMEFYTKNLDDLCSEESRNKFDNYTLKTVGKKKNIISEREKGLFNINFNSSG